MPATGGVVWTVKCSNMPEEEVAGHLRLNDSLWGVECTLAVIGTGGPVKRGAILLHLQQRELHHHPGARPGGLPDSEQHQDSDHRGALQVHDERGCDWLAVAHAVHAVRRLNH
eukprot:7897665-Pyramimonas_sp.AAC.1